VGGGVGRFWLGGFGVGRRFGGSDVKEGKLGGGGKGREGGGGRGVRVKGGGGREGGE